jgi:hypothetical protein
MNVETARDLLYWRTRWRAGEIAAADYAGIYFLSWQMAMFGRRFAARKNRHDDKPDLQSWRDALAVAHPIALRSLLVSYFSRYQFTAISSDVSAALCAWLEGRWALELREEIPSAAEVLASQAMGRRPVTLESKYPRMMEPMLHKANAFEFMVHDLEHGYKFFHDAALYEAQRTFFRNLSRVVSDGYFTAHCGDPVFAEKFRYLMSDMNTHPQHSGQYLRAILIEHYLTIEGRPLTGALSDESQRALARDLSFVSVNNG